jgi:uncharacterized protein (TIGR00251 family)
MTIPVVHTAEFLIFAVRVTPRAGRTSIAGVRGDALAVRVAAAPVDGAANDALLAFLAQTFDRPRRDVQIVSGHSSRDKKVMIAGLTETEFDARLNVILSA